MKNQVLLIDDSLTVQKVVSLTLDKNKFDLTIVKNKTEALKTLKEKAMDVVLVSDQVGDLVPSQFPKEVELWLAGSRSLEPMVLITSQDLNEVKHYVAVLRKPFAPPTLQSLISDLCLQRRKNAKPSASAPAPAEIDDFSEEKLHHRFQENFARESDLVSETFETMEKRESSPALEMFFTGQKEDPQATLNSAIEKALDRILPPIVEKMVRERLDSLLKEQEHFLEVKP